VGADEGTATTVRPATAGDVDVLAAIWRDGWHEAHAGRVPQELERERRAGSWHDEVRRRLPATWVAELDGHVVGFVTVVDDELEDIYVTAAARGTGVTATLLRHGEGVVRDAGFTAAWLAVVAANEGARRFYERHGWRDDGVFEHHARTASGPIAVPAHRYRRDVGAASAREALDATSELPAAVVARIRQICNGHAGVVEEEAWTGLRWRVGRTAIANLVMVMGQEPRQSVYDKIGKTYVVNVR